jgi:hypothetical protein
MTSVAHEGGRDAARSPLPSWGAAFAAAFVGWALASFTLVAVFAAAWELGLAGRPSGGGLRDWPYPDAGWGSLLANAIVWIWIFALTALLIRGLFADRIQRPVSAATIFVILVATGFAPAVPRGVLESPWPIALIFTAALLRLAPESGPAPLSKRTTAKLLAIGTGLLLIPAAHGLLHPLWPSPSFVEPMPPRSATFSLRNAAFAKVEVEAVSLRTPVPVVELVDVRVDDWPPFAKVAPRGLPFEIEPRSEAYIELRLRQLGCGTGAPAKARLRYRVFGLARSQDVPVRITPRRC